MMESKEDGGTKMSLLPGINSNIKEIDTNTVLDDFQDNPHKTCCSQRWILACMGGWLGIMSFMLNSSMNFAIVCMVKTDSDADMHKHMLNYETDYNNSINPNGTYFDNAETIAHLLSTTSTIQVNSTSTFLESTESCATSSKSPDIFSARGEFSWDKKTQSNILSSFYYGYMLMQIPGGGLAARFGGKRVIGTSMLLSSAITILMPVFARASVYLVIISRALLGLCLGTVAPSMCGLVGAWALPTERSRFLGMCWMGQNIGAVIGYSTSGILCVHGFDNGWASIFYIQGLVTLLFVCSWWFVIYNSPHEHPRISEAEKRFILKHLPMDETPNKGKTKDEIPWKHIFTYLPVYIVFINHICDAWTFYLLATCLPLFMKEVLLFDIQSNGIFSCLPFVSLIVGIAFAGMCADHIRSWGKVSITTIRKVFQISSSIGIAIFILIPGYLTCESRYGVIACFCLCTFFEAIGITAGHIPNVLDIAPRYSPLIFGVSNTIATIPGIVAPVVVGAITKNGSSEEWRIVFFIAAGVSVFAAVLYGLFADSELAPWATGKQDQIEIEVKLSNEKLTNGLIVT